MDRITSLWLSLQNGLHTSLSSPRHRDAEQGQGLVEYALILVLIAVVIIVTLALVGKKVSNIYSNISSGLGT